MTAATTEVFLEFMSHLFTSASRDVDELISTPLPAIWKGVVHYQIFIIYRFMEPEIFDKLVASMHKMRQHF